jgi:hypothetical protein
MLALKREGRSLPARNPLILSLVTIHGIPAAVRDEGVAVWFTVEYPGTSTPKYSSKGQLKAERRPAQDHIFFQGHSVTGIAPVSDDIKVSFFHGTLLSQQVSGFGLDVMCCMDCVSSIAAHVLGVATNSRCSNSGSTLA